MKKSNFFKISKNLFIESYNHSTPSLEMVKELEEIALEALETLRNFNTDLGFDFEGVSEIDAFIEAIGDNRDIEIFEDICFAFSIFICKVLCDYCGGRILYKFEAGYFDVVIGDIIFSPFQQIMIKFHDLDNEPKNDLINFVEDVYSLSLTSVSQRLVIDYQIALWDKEKKLALLN